MKTISNKTYYIAWFICLIVCSLVQAMPAWLTSDGMHSFAYDYDGKMQVATSLIDPDITVTYNYDPMGNRVGRVETNSAGQIVSEKKYILDYSSKVPKILLEMSKVSGNWQVTQKNYYYGNMLVMSTDGSNQNRRYYIHDRLGSVRAVTNRNIAVLNNYTYTPYGEDIASQTNETVINNVRYAGYNYDSELSQYYVWARMYSPYMSRFNGYDPVLGDFKEPLTLHQYLYCLNDPINAIDPDGRFLINDLNASTGIGASLYSAAANVGGRVLALAGQAVMALEFRGLQASLYANRLMGPIRNLYNSISTRVTPAGWQDMSNINGISYYSHALERLSQRGLTPSIIENALIWGQSSPGKEGRLVIVYDNVRVIFDPLTNTVITAMKNGSSFK